jgi:hypothetical protein
MDYNLTYVAFHFVSVFYNYGLGSIVSILAKDD